MFFQLQLRNLKLQLMLVFETWLGAAEQKQEAEG